MRTALNLLCAAGLLFAVGCDHIRDYSVNSYQGVLPSGDMKPAPVVMKSSTSPAKGSKTAKAPGETPAAKPSSAKK